MAVLRKLQDTNLDELIVRASDPANSKDAASCFEKIYRYIFAGRGNSKETMRAFKHHLAQNNGKDQVLTKTLNIIDKLLDTHRSQFIFAIANKEFTDTLLQIVEDAETSQDLKYHIKLYFVKWAESARKGSYPNMLTIWEETCQQLKDQGEELPQLNNSPLPFVFRELVIDPPDWTDSDYCERCREPFTVVNRKHHCRCCGGIFCQLCSSEKIPLHHLDYSESVRICKGCHRNVTLARIGKDADKFWFMRPKNDIQT
ncbi:hypothetical protein VTP01DRAFT_2249 [Rhizomucor pusillus]|uniref:uncharacterized protein n=1 Tax=Rhizomucor pusillus TaxID=4840 RepID=UPI003741E983